MRVDQAIAEILKREGIEQVFLFPFTPILEAISAAGIRPIVARQERVAENMADGFSRISNGKRIGTITVPQTSRRTCGVGSSDTCPPRYAVGSPPRLAAHAWPAS